MSGTSVDANAPSVIASCPSPPPSTSCKSDRLDALRGHLPSPIRLPSLDGFEINGNFRGSQYFQMREWLGDAFLNFCNAIYCEHLEPNVDPSSLTNFRRELRSRQTHKGCTEHCYFGADEQSMHKRVNDVLIPHRGRHGDRIKAYSDWLEAYFGFYFELFGFDDSKVWDMGKRITIVGLAVMISPQISRGNRKILSVQAQVRLLYCQFIFSFAASEVLWSLASQEKDYLCQQRRALVMSLLEDIRGGLCRLYPDQPECEPCATTATDPKDPFLAAIRDRASSKFDLATVSTKLLRDLLREPSVKEKLDDFRIALGLISDICQRKATIVGGSGKPWVATFPKTFNDEQEMHFSNEKLCELLKDLSSNGDVAKFLSTTPLQSKPLRKRKWKWSNTSESTEAKEEGTGGSEAKEGQPTKKKWRGGKGGNKATKEEKGKELGNS